MSRKPFIAGNWKMNGSRSMAADLAGAISAGSEELSACDIGLFPPAIYLPLVAEKLAASDVICGAQTLNENEAGAFTGEISAEMVADIGGTHVLVGHSERREYYGETNEIVAAKAARALQAGLIPVLCVGETLEQREAGTTEAVVGSQLDAVLQECGVQAFDTIIIAYEPVWAIGTGKTATPEQAQAVHQYIRSKLSQKSAQGDATIAGRMRILYGGSMKPSNAAELLAQPDIDGGLIGGASLKAEDFLAICRAGNAAAQ